VIPGLHSLRSLIRDYHLPPLDGWSSLDTYLASRGRLSIRVDNLHALAALALTVRDAGFTPRARARPTPTRLSQHGTNRLSALTAGSPSGALRSAQHKVINDQLAAPSRSGSGARRASIKIRSRACAS
jgi:hypothetical protein